MVGYGTHADRHKGFLRHMLLLLLLSPAQAWWETRYMLTAAIALKSMNKAQVDEATKLLKGLKEILENQMVSPSVDR